MCLAIQFDVRIPIKCPYFINAFKMCSKNNVTLCVCYTIQHYFCCRFYFIISANFHQYKNFSCLKKFQNGSLKYPVTLKQAYLGQRLSLATQPDNPGNVPKRLIVFSVHYRTYWQHWGEVFCCKKEVTNGLPTTKEVAGRTGCLPRELERRSAKYLWKELRKSFAQQWDKSS